MRAWQATVQDEAGNAVFNPQVTVYQEDGSTLADIFNEDGSSKENPFIGTTEGFAQFWAERGTYKVVGANGGVSETWQVDLADEEALELAREAKAEAEQAKLPPYIPFDIRAQAEVASIPSSVQYINVAGLQYVRDPDGTALETGGGVKWSPVDLEVRPEHFGITGAGDETAAITRMLDWTSQHGVAVRWQEGTYSFSEYICPHAEPKVIWRGGPGAILRSTKTSTDGSTWEDECFINISGTTDGSAVQVGSTMLSGETHVSLSSETVNKITPGKTLLQFYSSRVIETDDRGQARHGMIVGVSRIVDSTTVELTRPVPVTMMVGDEPDAVITGISGNTITVDSFIGRDTSEMRYRVIFLGVGVNRYPGEFNPVTGTFTFVSGVPSGVTVGSSVRIERSINMWVRRHCEVDISGLTLTRDPHVDATPGDMGFRGLIISGAYRPAVKNFRTENFSEGGVTLRNSYQASFVNQDHVNCNRSYDESDGTGYGVSVSQTSWGEFVNIKGFGCRRTLDFTGTQMVSHDNVARDIQGFGGGTTYTGERFWPNGDALPSVVGSHGGAIGTLYSDTRGVDVYSIINLRGSEEVVRGVHGAGRVHRMINSFRGDGVDASGLYFTDGRPDWVNDRDTESKYTRRGKLTMVVSITARDINPSRPHHISNIVVRGLDRSIVGLIDGGTVGPITVGGVIDITTDNELGQNNLLHYIDRSGSGATTLGGPVYLGQASIKNSQSSPKDGIRWFNQNQFSLADGAFVRLPGGQYFVQIPDDEVRRIPAESWISVVSATVVSVNRDRTWRFSGGLLQTGRNGDFSPNPSSNEVDVINSEPTGTSGEDGKVTLAYRPTGVGSYLYIENRLGSTENFLITCNGLL